MGTNILNDEEQAIYGERDRYDYLKTMDDLELAIRVRIMNSENENQLFRMMVEELIKRYTNLLAK